MDVYVATKAENYEVARWVMQAVEARGHDITYDWTNAVEQHGPGVLDDSTAVQQATQDAEGAAKADVLVVIAHPNLCGTLIEWGIAQATNTPILCLGHPVQYTIFQHLGNVKIFEGSLQGLREVLDTIDSMQDTWDDEDEAPDLS